MRVPDAAFYPRLVDWICSTSLGLPAGSRSEPPTSYGFKIWVYPSSEEYAERQGAQGGIQMPGERDMYYPSTDRNVRCASSRYFGNRGADT
jgi:hypothetical protein